MKCFTADYFHPIQMLKKSFLTVFIGSDCQTEKLQTPKKALGGDVNVVFCLHQGYKFQKNPLTLALRSGFELHI